MENKGKKNRKIYLSTVVIITIVYLVLFIFGMATRLSIIDEKNRYQNNQKKQPINNIITNHNDNQNNNNNSHNHNQNSNSGIVFLYDYDEDNYIDMDNQFPTDDETGMNLVGDKYTHDFKIKISKVALGYQYRITLKKEKDSDLEDKWVKIYLTNDESKIKNCFRDNGKVKTFNEYPNYLSNIYEKVLYENVVTYQDIQKGYKEFTLRMWVSEDLKVVNEEYLQKIFKAKLIVYAEEL